MTTLDRYLDAATRDNARRSYQSAVRHFEVEWGGHLPATADSVAHYLADHADHAGQLATNTLKQRLAALAQWHVEHGFADPTGRRSCARCSRASRRCTPPSKSAPSPCN